MLGRGLTSCLAVLALARSAGAAETVLDLSGDVPDGGPDHFFVPFDVPAGTVEIEIAHDDLSDKNVLDWGLADPNGHRGWGGGNSENAIVGVDAASRSYVPGPIPAGTWQVVVGKALIEESPAKFQLTVTLRDTPTLAAQPERKPYTDRGALSSGARWYAGDFHVHSRESGDAQPTLNDVIEFSKSRGLDFILLSDHNTLTQLDFFAQAAQQHPDFLLLPGMEFTTYAGHANAIGATSWVDHKLGQPGVTIEASAKAFGDQGALFSINHPTLDVGNLCLGCAWEHDLALERIDAVEIGTGALATFEETAIDFWDDLCAQGRHLAALGGSDDHDAGQGQGPFKVPIGSPTTMVFAEELSVDAIVAAIRAGRTVVKLGDPTDPMVELSSSVSPDGDSIEASSVTFTARVTGGAGQEVRFVRNGERLQTVSVDADPFETTLTVNAGDGETRVRAEVLVEGLTRTVTSHLYLQARNGGSDGSSAAGDSDDDGGCGCRTAPGPATRLAALALLLAAGALFGRPRQR